jgi:pimeloyl-ACP methyl ester carboxylesterase
MLKTWIITLIIISSFTQLASTTLASEDQGEFNYTHAHKTILIRYLNPSKENPSTPVLIVMHGVARDADRYFSEWAPYARKYGLLLIVPEFSKKEFPGAEGYNDGNVVDKAGHPLPREVWAYSAIEPIFDAVKERTGNLSKTYSLFGHSAGAQFVQRYIYFIPNARLNCVISANAGWYMLPDLSVAFPYGLKNTPISESDLKHALQLPFTVLLGTADIDPNNHSLRHTPESDAQGLNRLDRGHYFFSYAKKVASTYHTPLNWKLATAPGIDHEDGRMAPFAMAIITHKN